MFQRRPREETIGVGTGERRLAYVAMMRAKTHLELVYTKVNPSRFLAEAGLTSARA